MTFLYAMTVTIANVSLPQMQGAFSATQDQIAWVVTANLVATAVATPLAGWPPLAVRAAEGVQRVRTSASARPPSRAGSPNRSNSSCSSACCRVRSARRYVPASQAIVLDTYPRRQHGAVIAIYGMGSVLGPIVGPVVGGYLSEAYDWRWVFHMITPFSVLALLGTWLFIEDRESPARYGSTGWASCSSRRCSRPSS